MIPFINNIDSPTYKLARWLSQKIQFISEMYTFINKNTQDFVEKIKNMNLNSEDRLVSFYVKALFPSIPVDILMESLKNGLIVLHSKIRI